MKLSLCAPSHARLRPAPRTSARARAREGPGVASCNSAELLSSPSAHAPQSFRAPLWGDLQLCLLRTILPPLQGLRTILPPEIVSALCSPTRSLSASRPTEGSSLGRRGGIGCVDFRRRAPTLLSARVVRVHVNIAPALCVACLLRSQPPTPDRHTLASLRLLRPSERSRTERSRTSRCRSSERRRRMPMTAA